MATRAPKADALKRVEAKQAEQSMVTLASLSGNAMIAAQVLEEEHAIFTSADELQMMRVGKYREMYERLQEEMGAHLEEMMIREAREVANRALVLERKLLDATEQQLANNKMLDPARAAAHVSKVKQTSIDKMLALTGRPTKITASQDAATIIRALEGKGVLVPIEAPSIVDGDVVED